MLSGLAIVPVSLQSFAMIGDIGETKAKMEETKGEVKGEMEEANGKQRFSRKRLRGNSGEGHIHLRGSVHMEMATGARLDSANIHVSIQ